MTCRWIAVRALPLMLSFTLLAQPTAQPADPLVERVGDTGFLQLQAESFRQLDAKHQALAYWLTQASIAIDPIIYDQLSAFAIREKRLLEEIVARPQGIPKDTFAKIRSYALLFWANRGNHNETTGQKFLPGFTAEELLQSALRAHEQGALRSPYADLSPLTSADAVRAELTALHASIFDASFEPTITAKTPPPGKDIIQASSNTFYRNVTLA
jgi:dipeptidyl-peptidase-3